MLQLRDLQLGFVELLASDEPELAKDSRQACRGAIAHSRVAAPEREELVGEGLRLVAPEPLDRPGQTRRPLPTPVSGRAGFAGAAALSGFGHADARGAAGGGPRVRLRP